MIAPDPVAQLRAVAVESRARAVLIAGSPVRVALLVGAHDRRPTEAEALAIGAARTAALVRHHEGRARLYDRCADAAERCGSVPWWTP